MATKIKELFPEECTQVYYIKPTRKKDSKDDKAGRSKGKLVDKYRNSVTFIRRANKLRESNSNAGTLPVNDRKFLSTEHVIN